MELNKINIDKDLDEMTPLERACAYLRYAAEPGKEEFIAKLLSRKEEAIEMAENVLKKVSADERMKELQRSIEMAEMDQQVRMEYARGQGFEQGHEQGHEEGHEQGHEQGLEQGREEGIVALLSTLKKLGVTRDVAKKELISNYRLEDAEADRWITKFWE